MDRKMDEKREQTEICKPEQCKLLAEARARTALLDYQECMVCGSTRRNVCCRTCGQGCDGLKEAQKESKKLSKFIDSIKPTCYGEYDSDGECGECDMQDMCREASE